MSGRFVVGSYVPGTSAIHRLDARVKVVLLFAATIALFGVAFLPALVGVLVAGVACARVAGVPLGRVARNLAPMAVVFAFVLAANGLRLDGTGAVALAGPLGLAPDGLLRGAAAVTRIACMVVLAVLVSGTTSVNELTEALLWLLAPLGRLRVPVDDVATVLSIALRFIPVVGEQLRRVELAQRARGARVGQGSPIHRVTSWVPVLVPVMVGLFRRSDALARAMEARCYRGEGRTRLTRLRLRAQDVVVLLVGLVAFAALAAAL